MRSVNRMTLVGTVGRDPDIHEDQDGTKVGYLSVATKKTQTDGTRRTYWHRVTFQPHLAQFVEDCIRKGDRVYIEGPLEYDAYERNGLTIPTAEIVAREIVLLAPAESPPAPPGRPGRTLPSGSTSAHHSPRSAWPPT